MSLTSLLLAFAPTIAARLKKSAREIELEDEVKRLEFALDHWRTSCHALWAENDRLRQPQTAQWLPRTPELDAQYRAQMQQMQQTQYAAAAQMNQQAQQIAAQNQYNMQLAQNYYATPQNIIEITCVPARSRVLLA